MFNTLLMYTDRLTSILICWRSITNNGAGEEIALLDNNGSLRINLTVPLELDTTDIIWKVFLTPHGDRFPNMLTEVGLNLPITEETSHQCPYLPLTSNVIIRDDTDFILIESFDTNSTFELAITYALNTQKEGEISVNVMDERTNEWIFGIIPVENTNHENKTIHLHMDHFLTYITDHIYLDVSLNPVGLDWYHRLAEDRTYQLLV